MQSPLQQDDTEGRPSQQEEAKRNRDEPVEWRKLVSSSEDDVQRRRVNDKHAQARPGNDAVEVVLVTKDLLAEGDVELGFDREDVKTLDDED